MEDKEHTMKDKNINDETDARSLKEWTDYPLRLFLRPHHGMCLAYFVGEGYSDTFSLHMQHVLDKLQEGAEVVLILEPDEICSACPNRKGKNNKAFCTQEKKVSYYDRAVLSKLGRKENEVILFSAFAKEVERTILAPGHRVEICGNCKWNELCQRVPSRFSIQDKKKEME